VRAFFGGAHDERAVDLPEKELIALAQSELKQILGITAEPEFAMSSRWLRAMPQYEVGHLDCVVKINQLAATLEGLALCGSAYSGVGVPDCVRSGREVAKSVI
jgi:oxygen-dependent protoporphyrinogen oxidase